MRLANFRFERMLRQRRFDPRNEIVAIRRIIGMLKLASAAFGKMPAGRLLMMRSERQRSIVEQGIAGNCERHVPAACGHPVATGRDSDDQLVHKRSSAAGIACTRSSAIMCGPAISAARP